MCLWFYVTSVAWKMLFLVSLGYHDKPSSMLIFVLEIFEAHGRGQKVSSFKKGFFSLGHKFQQTFYFLFVRLTCSDKMPHSFLPLDFFVGNDKVEKNLYFWDLDHKNVLRNQKSCKVVWDWSSRVHSWDNTLPFTVVISLHFDTVLWRTFISIII